MDDPSTITALRRVTADLVAHADSVVALHALVAAVPSATGARTSGLLVSDRDGSLQLLAATTPEAVPLELQQAFADDGPAHRSMRIASTVRVSVDEVAASWPHLGSMLDDQGLGHLVAAPLLWRGRPLGSLNIFFDRGDAPSDVQVEAGEVLADMAMVAILLDASEPEVGAVSAALEESVDARALIEQAKGVIAVQEDVDLDGAFLTLTRRARAASTSVRETAALAVARAQAGRPWDDVV